MRLSDVSRFATGFDGVKESRGDGMSTWRCRGRLMVRQLDDTHVVIRSSFDAQDLLLRSFRETFIQRG